MEHSKFPFLQDHSTVLAYNQCVLKLKLSYHNLNHVRKEILTKALTKNSAHTQIEDAIRAIIYNLEREFDLVTIQTENFVIHPEECSWPLVSSQKLSHLVIKGENYRFHPNLILLNIYSKDPIVVSKQISKEKNDILNKILIKDNRTNKNIALLPELSNTSHNKPQSSDVTNDLNCGNKVNTLILATPRLATNDVGSQSPRKHNKIVELLHKHDSSAVQKSQSTDNGMNIASSSKKLRGTNYKSKLHLSSTKNKQRVSSPKKICPESLSTEQSVDFETDETTSSKGSSMKSIPLKRKSKEENGKGIKTKLDHSPVKKRKVTKPDYSVPVDTNDINYNISQENDDNIIICPEKRYDISEANVTNVKPLLRSVANKNLKTSSYDISELNDKQQNNEDKFIRDVNKEKKNHYNLSEPIFQSSSKKMSKNCVIEISKDGSIIEEAESTERCKGFSNETQLNGGSDVKRNDGEYEDKKSTTLSGAATNSRNRKKKLDKETNHAHSNNVLNSETQAKETRKTVHNSAIETRSKKTLPSKITNARKINKTNIVQGSLSDISSSSMSSDTETKKHGIKSNVFKQAESSNRPHTRSTSRESSRQTRSSSSLSTRSGQRHTGVSSKQSAPKAENHYPKVSVWLSKKANIPN
ncbi:uncharacterized protein LOC131957791 isoform X2 [Physella acuta]|uniref:uncharacterized protein LOC131957791 isoform X2 n=1 Tax=Physella acuta TaxID=109671 RepID=UPI0027DB2009|nr:uncharacterized protein LOC131957791 isoform X2 [Physella acuta]